MDQTEETDATRAFLIREATRDDMSAAAQLLEAAFSPLRPIYQPVGEALARQQQRYSEGVRIVAEVEGRIVGTTQFVVRDKFIHLIGLAVDAAFRRRGVARKLIERIVAIGRSVGRHLVRLDTIRETGNVAVFTKLGFYVIDEYVASWCKSERCSVVHEVIMERPIRPTESA
jgi:ribosomal protein S18 acetylase RimI-like enzyme